MDIDGECLCGAIKYRGQIDPGMIAVCHCTDCQANSGSAFGTVAHLTAFELIQGTLKIYLKTGSSGKQRTLAFCGDCGTRIYAKNADDSPGFWGLRIGSCNQRAEMTPKLEVWCDSKLPWVGQLDGSQKHPRNPGFVK